MTFRIAFALLLCAVAFSAFAQSAEEVDVVVVSRDLPRGAVISESDLAYKPVPVVRANASIVRSIADLTGMETRRALRAGELIRNIDVKRHALVAKGTTVTMVFEAKGIKLTSVGRAMADGADGDVITVLNPASFRQVQALVVAPGTVRVGETLSLAAARP
jgi:flagella basal body P-ring formation protein FlgA